MRNTLSISHRNVCPRYPGHDFFAKERVGHFCKLPLKLTDRHNVSGASGFTVRHMPPRIGSLTRCRCGYALLTLKDRWNGYFVAILRPERPVHLVGHPNIQQPRTAHQRFRVRPHSKYVVAADNAIKTRRHVREIAHAIRIRCKRVVGPGGGVAERFKIFQACLGRWFPLPPVVLHPKYLNQLLGNIKIRTVRIISNECYGLKWYTQCMTTYSNKS